MTGERLLLGLDPGLGTTGYGLLRVKASRELVLVEAGTIDTDARLPIARRLCQLHDDLAELLSEATAAHGALHSVAVEELYSHYRHPRTAITMGHARGVLLLAAAQRGIDVAAYPATRVKSAVTGHGGASKEQVGRSVQALLQLAQVPLPADVTDALAIAVCHANALGRGSVETPHA